LINQPPGGKKFYRSLSDLAAMLFVFLWHRGVILSSGALASIAEKAGW
jgi:hypothetical protein